VAGIVSERTDLDFALDPETVIVPPQDRELLSPPSAHLLFHCREFSGKLILAKLGEKITIRLRALHPVPGNAVENGRR